MGAMNWFDCLTLAAALLGLVAVLGWEVVRSFRALRRAKSARTLDPPSGGALPDRECVP